MVLGFDTSASHCGAVLLYGDQVLAEFYENMTKGQAERLMPMLEECLTSGGVGWGDLDRIGVGIGPGNFTGIRISVSAARGLALALDIPAIGVSALEALAFGSSGVVISSLDARRGDIFMQVFGNTERSEPILTALMDLPSIPAGTIPTCIGFAAETIALSCAGAAAPAKYAPASAIARIAAKRAVRPDARPAPLYLRSADAAPSKTAAPVLLS